MPEWRLSLRRSQVLERTRVAQREEETAQSGLSSVSTYGVRQVSIFRHFVRRFLPFTISDQTYFEDHDTPSRRTPQINCRALRHTIRHVTKSPTFFRSVLPLHYI